MLRWWKYFELISGEESTTTSTRRVNQAAKQQDLSSNELYKLEYGNPRTLVQVLQSSYWGITKNWRYRKWALENKGIRLSSKFFNRVVRRVMKDFRRWTLNCLRVGLKFSTSMKLVSTGPTLSRTILDLKKLFEWITNKVIHQFRKNLSAGFKEQSVEFVGKWKSFCISAAIDQESSHWPLLFWWALPQGTSNIKAALLYADAS